MNQLVDYHESRPRLIELRKADRPAEQELATAKAEPVGGDAESGQEAGPSGAAGRRGLGRKPRAIWRNCAASSPRSNPIQRCRCWARQHAEIGTAVLNETAKLHTGDAENLRLWREFMPPCLDAFSRFIGGLGVMFDVTLGESFYHHQIGRVVDDLLKRGIAARATGRCACFSPAARPR